MDNPVGRALQNVSGTIERAGQRSGQNKIDMANIGLAKSKMDYDMNDPVQQLQRTQAAQKIQQASLPFTPAYYTGGNQNGFETGLALVDKKNPNMTVFDLVAKNYGFDQFDDKSGQWFKEENGQKKVFTRGDYEAAPDVGNSIYLAHTNLYKIARGHVEQANTRIPVSGDPDEIIQLEQQRTEAQEFLDSPRKQIMGLMEQSIKLSSFGDRFKGAIMGIDKKITFLQSSLEQKEWSVPYTDEAGNTVQKNLGTNKISVLKKAATEKPPTPAEIRARAKDVTKEEKTILQNPGNAAVQPSVDFFNQYATKPHCYLFKERESGQWKSKIPYVGGLFSDGKMEKIALPVYQGHKVTAADVWKTATDNNMKYEDVLKGIGAIE